MRRSTHLVFSDPLGVGKITTPSSLRGVEGLGRLLEIQKFWKLLEKFKEARKPAVFQQKFENSKWKRMPSLGVQSLDGENFAQKV